MVRIVSFVKRPITEIEKQSIAKVLQDDIDIIRHVRVESTDDIINVAPSMTCDAILINVRTYRTPIMISKCVDHLVINLRTRSNRRTHNTKFIGLAVYKEGSWFKFFRYKGDSPLKIKPTVRKFPRLKELRKSFNMSQEDISKILKVHQSYYSRVEQGKDSLDSHYLITLAQVYNTSTDYILGLSNDPKPR